MTAVQGCVKSHSIMFEMRSEERPLLGWKCRAGNVGFSAHPYPI